MVNLFFEPSTRTRASFEIAEKRLSADSLGITASASSPGQGARRCSTRRATSRRWARTSSSCATPSRARRAAGADHARSSVINAGDGAHEHPTQALLDAFTIRQRKGRLAGLKVAIVGDIAHSRVARSNIHLLTKLGAEVVVCGPPTLMPPGIAALGVEVICTTSTRRSRGADVVMMLRIQLEREQARLRSPRCASTSRSSG